MSEEERRRGRAEEVKGETEWKMKGKHGKDESVRKIRKGIKRVASFQVDKMHCPALLVLKETANVARLDRRMNQTEPDRESW